MAEDTAVSWRNIGLSAIYQPSKDKREMDIMGISEASSNQLGWFEGTQYIISPNAEDILADLLESASKEGGCWKLNRLGFLKDDLIPFLIHVEDEPKVFALCTKLLLLLTQPLECFVDGGMTSAGVLFHTKEMLRDSKELIYRNPTIIKAMFREMNGILDCCGNFAPSTEDVEVINNCLLILRNVLYTGEEDKNCSHEHLFLVMFKEGFSDLFCRLMKIGCRHWTVSMVQLLSLMYKDVTSVALMLELSLGQSKDAAKKMKNFANFAQQMKETAAEEDDDDSDDDLLEEDEEEEEEEEEEEDEGDGEDSAAHEMVQVSEEEAKNQADPPVSPKDADAVMESENCEFDGDDVEYIQINDELMRYLRGNFDGRELKKHLASFGVAIMKNGFKDLVANLLSYLTDPSSLFLDDSYLTWLLSYFLKFVFLPEMNYDLVEGSLSLDIVNFVTYQAVKAVEELTCEQRDNDLEDNHPHQSISLRKVHLCVMALREVFHSLNYVANNMKLSKEAQSGLVDNLLRIASLQDLRHLFILLLRTCPLTEPHKVYLRDIIITNHVYLLLMEYLLNQSTPDVQNFNSKFSMLSHVKMFSEKSIVSAYGYMLETYDKNIPCLNDCIMTMLHHVSGDCNKSESLLQYPILSTFMEIYENEFPLGRESMELIEYILCKFEASCEEEKTQRVENPAMKSKEVQTGGTDGKYVKETDMAEADSGVSVGFPLGSQEDQQESDVSSFCSSSSAMETDSIVPDHRGTMKKFDYPLLHQLLINVSAGYVETIRRLSPNCRQGLNWVSRRLFETCYVKLKMAKNGDCDHLEEPVPYYCNHFGSSVPMVPYTVEENRILNDPLFISILRQLGFHLHEGRIALFPRIPSMWGPEKLHQIGLLLSPERPDKFTEKDVQAFETSMDKRTIGI